MLTLIKITCCST